MLSGWGSVGVSHLSGKGPSPFQLGPDASCAASGCILANQIWKLGSLSILQAHAGAAARVWVLFYIEYWVPLYIEYWVPQDYDCSGT